MNPADIMVEAKPEIRSKIVGLRLSSKVCGLYFYRGSSFLELGPRESSNLRESG